MNKPFRLIIDPVNQYGNPRNYVHKYPEGVTLFNTLKEKYPEEDISDLYVNTDEYHYSQRLHLDFSIEELEERPVLKKYFENSFVSKIRIRMDFLPEFLDEAYSDVEKDAYRGKKITISYGINRDRFLDYWTTFGCPETLGSFQHFLYKIYGPLKEWIGRLNLDD